MTIKTPLKENHQIVDRLIAWGLSSAEAGVYVYLLQKPRESGGTKIALGTGLHRQYVYLALTRLIELRLIETVAVGKHKKYKARSPLELEKITRKRSIDASDLVQDLNKISAINNDQDFEVLQGAKQIQQYELDYVYESEEGEEEYIIGGESKGFREVMGDQLDEYLEDKKKKNIRVCYLGSEEERKEYEESIGMLSNQESRFMKGMPQGATHMVIRKDSVLFFSFLTPPLVYVIKSETVARDYRQFFQMLWGMAL